MKVNILCHNRLTKRVVQLFHFQNNLAGCRRRDFCLLDLVQVRSAKPQRPDFLIGQGFHLLRGKFPHNFPFLHTQEAVCQIHQIVKPVFRYNDGFSLLLQSADNVCKAVGRCNIQIGGRFIHDIDFRVNRFRRRNRNFLAHPIRQAVQTVIQNVLNFDVCRCPVNMVPNFLMGIPIVLTAESNLTSYLIGKKLAPGVLKNISRDFAALPGWNFFQRLPVHENLAAQFPLVKVGDQAVNHSRQRAFPTS